jgi:apolipoprotein N-acyltransferase
MGPGGGDDDHSHANDSVRSVLTANDKTALFAVALILLTIPSYIGDSLPVPLGDVSKATPFVVGCALPTVDEYKVPEFKFEHFLDESKRLDNTANFILWPEGAVHFSSEKERNDSLAEVQNKIHHAFVGVSFEETIENTKNSNNRHGAKRTGIAIVSNRSTTPHLLYYKQHLVPSKFSFQGRFWCSNDSHSHRVLLAHSLAGIPDHFLGRDNLPQTNPRA